MPAYALADLLPDFGAPRGAPRRSPQPSAPAGPDPAGFVLAAAGPSANEIEEAVQAAEAAVETRLAEAHAQELAAIEERHAAEIARLGAELGDRAGRTISAGLEQMESELVSLASAVVARVLGAALTEEVKRTAVEELGRSIVDAVGDREAVRIRVTGPLSLYEALKPGLGRYAERVEFSESDGFDLTVAIDSSLFETRMADWSVALSEVLS